METGGGGETLEHTHVVEVSCTWKHYNTRTLHVPFHCHEVFDAKCYTIVQCSSIALITVMSHWPIWRNSYSLIVITVSQMTVSISPCIHISIPPCIHISIPPCIHISIPPCIHISIPPCIHISIPLHHSC